MSIRRIRRTFKSCSSCSPWNAHCHFPAAPTANAQVESNERPTREQQRNSFAGRDDEAIDARLVKRAVCLLLCSLKKPKNERCPKAQVKNCLASWLLSADNTTNARRSKAIGRRFYDDGACVTRPPVCKCREHRLKSPWGVRFWVVAQIFRDRRLSEEVNPSREFNSTPDEKILARSDSRRKIVGIGCQ